MQNQFKTFGKKEEGQGMTEYILIVALIALVAVVGVKLFGGKLQQLFVNKAQELESVVPTPEH